MSTRVASQPARRVATVSSRVTAAARPSGAGGLLVPDAVAPTVVGDTHLYDGPILFSRSDVGATDFAAVDAAVEGVYFDPEPDGSATSIHAASPDGSWVIAEHPAESIVTVHYRTGSTWARVGEDIPSVGKMDVTTDADGVSWLVVDYLSNQAVRVYRLDAGDVTLWSDVDWDFANHNGPFTFAWAPDGGSGPPRLAIGTGANRVNLGPTAAVMVMVWTYTDGVVTTAVEIEHDFIVGLGGITTTAHQAQTLAWNDAGTRLAVFLDVFASGIVGVINWDDLVSRVVLYDPATGDLLVEDDDVPWADLPSLVPAQEGPYVRRRTWSSNDQIEHMHWTGDVLVATGHVYPIVYDFDDGYLVDPSRYIRAWDTTGDQLTQLNALWHGPYSFYVAVEVLSAGEVLIAQGATAAWPHPRFQLFSIDADGVARTASEIAVITDAIEAAITGDIADYQFNFDWGVVFVAGTAARATATATGQRQRVAS